MRLGAGQNGAGSGDYLLVQDHAVLNYGTGTSNRGFRAGEVANANNNYIKVTTSATFTERQGQPIAIGGDPTNLGGNPNNYGNYMEVSDGATANLNMVYVMGNNDGTGTTANKFILGNGGAVANANIYANVGSYAQGVYLHNSYARMEINNGEMTAQANGSLVSGAGAITITNSAIFSTAQAASTIGCPISGAGNLYKLDTGTLTLNGAISYTGSTSILAGTLSLGTTSYGLNGLSNTAADSIAGGAFINLGYTGTVYDTIGSLYYNGDPTALSGGTYGAAGSGAQHEVSWITGSLTDYLVVPYLAPVFSGSATWNSDGTTHLWNTPGNWLDGGITSVGVPGVTSPLPGSAIFSGSGSVVAIDLTGVNPNLKSLTFSNSGYTLSNGSLTLQNTTGPATVTVSSGTQSIDSTVTLTLASSTNMDIQGTSELKIGANIGQIGTPSLTKLGSGTLVLSGTNNYTGGTVVNAGILAITDSHALPDEKSLTVGAGGTLIFDPLFSGSPVQGLPSIAASSVAVNPVPEPSTLALLIAGLVMGFGARWRGKK